MDTSARHEPAKSSAMLRGVRVRPRCAAWAAGLVACATATPGALPPPIDDLVAANDALGDPHSGRYPLDDALEGLPPGDRLVARLRTDEGEVVCRLDASHAPLTVASFVGLARGRRPFRDEHGAWQRAPYYDGVPWHRAEPGQFVQTGRRGRLEDGGFLLQDEVSPGDDFSRAGVLAMANKGEPHSGSVQFFVTTGPATHLQGQHTIFGRCDQEAVVRRLEARVSRGETPMLQAVAIERTAG
jgi:peptidyl-prolyl cis-trans isomerase A (cyclophilin A)